MLIGTSLAGTGNTDTGSVGITVAAHPGHPLGGLAGDAASQAGHVVAVGHRLLRHRASEHRRPTEYEKSHAVSGTRIARPPPACSRRAWMSGVGEAMTRVAT